MNQTTEKNEAKSKARSAHLLAKGYEPVIGLTVPVGLSNEELVSSGGKRDPENAERLSIERNGKEKLNLYVFHPAKVKEGEKTPVIYFIHGGGYHFGTTGMDEEKIQGVADASNATVFSPDYTLSLDPSYEYPMELEEVYAGLLYVYNHAEELNVDKDNIVVEGESAGGGLAARLVLYNRDKGEVPLCMDKGEQCLWMGKADLRSEKGAFR